MTPTPKGNKEDDVSVKEPVAPPIQSVEVFGEDIIQRARVYPQIRVGVCEFHGTPYGVVDKDTMKGKCRHVCATDPLCPHSKEGCLETPCRHEHNYDGLTIRCTYCPANADFRGIIAKRTFYIYGHPDDANKLIMCCSDYRCMNAHQKRFQKQNL